MGRWIKGSVDSHRQTAPSLKTGCLRQRGGRSLHICKLIALVPCGWCKGRHAVSPTGCSHTGAEEAVGPPGWQGPAAITLSLYSSQPDGSRLGRAGSIPGSSQACGGGGSAGEGVLLPAACQPSSPLVPLPLGQPGAALVFPAVGRSPARSVAITLLKSGSLQPAPAG